ncbi:7309_t:CDS:2, partial [Gigaspora rosea]
RNISVDISKKLTLILTKALTIDYSNLKMQQQVQSFLEDYFEKPEGSNIEGNKSNESANPCGNGTTPSKEKDLTQERSKTKNLCHDSNNAKFTTSTEVQEMQIPIIELKKDQTKHIDAHLLEAHPITSKSKHKKNVKKVGNNLLYAHESDKENVQPSGIALLSVVDTTNTRSLNSPQSRNSRNNSQKNQCNLSMHNEDNGKSMMDLLCDIMKRLELIEVNQKGRHAPIAPNGCCGHLNRAGVPFKCTCVGSPKEKSLDKTWENIEAAIFVAARKTVPYAKTLSRAGLRCSPLRVWNNRIRRINHLAEIRIDNALEGKLTEESERAKSAEIRNYIQRRAEMIVSNQKEMLTSLLERTHNK